MKYIATRERVEKLEGSGPVTKNQETLLRNLLRDFPDAKELDEYKDYSVAPTSGNASALISAALDANAHEVAGRDGYMKYIATRPRVERHGEHGLFSSRPVSLSDSLKEIEIHTGNVWTFIWSLRREDAARLGYGHAESWRKLFMAHQVEIAEAMKIPPDQLRWRAALGMLLLEQRRISEAISWYERAAEAGNQYAQYHLGKLYLQGRGVPKDILKATECLTASANQGNRYAQYALGKLYLSGSEVPQDKEQAAYWLTQSAEQGHQYAQFLLDRLDDSQSPAILLSVTRLLHHMSRVFQETPPPSNPVKSHVDSKLMQRIREKKIAAGHKADDHEDQGYAGPAM